MIATFLTAFLLSLCGARSARRSRLFLAGLVLALYGAGLARCQHGLPARPASGARFGPAGAAASAGV
jgi:hypothetical protein